MKQITYTGDDFITLELENVDGSWSLVPVHHTVDNDGITHEQPATQLEVEDDIAGQLLGTGVFEETE